MKTAALIASALLLAGCSTVELPDIGGQLADFRKDIDNLDSAYMQAEELPDMPSEVRSDREWDQAAREMLALRDSFTVPDLEPAMSDADFDREYAAAVAAARAYKADDPQ